MDHTITLAANEIFPLRENGNKYKILDATGTLQLRFDSSNKWIERQKGQGQVKSEHFNTIYLKSGSTQTIKISVGYDLEIDDTSTVNEATATVEGGNDTAESKQTILSGQTYTVPANLSRKALIIQNDPENTNDVYIQVGKTATTGIKYGQGEERAWATTSAMVIKNLDVANSVDVIIQEVQKV